MRDRILAVLKAAGAPVSEPDLYAKLGVTSETRVEYCTTLARLIGLGQVKRTKTFGPMMLSLPVES
jgi:hypothetical protein